MGTLPLLTWGTTRTSPFIRLLSRYFIKNDTETESSIQRGGIVASRFQPQCFHQIQRTLLRKRIYCLSVPIWLFWRIHLMDPLSSSPFFLVITILSTYLVSFAYKNTKFVLKHKVAIKREEAVNREISKKMAEDKKMNKKEKDERILR